MDSLNHVTRPARRFVKNSSRLVKKCTKPDRKGTTPRHHPTPPHHTPSSLHCPPEFNKLAIATTIGFAVMGFIGFFVKLIHIPINNILVGGAN